MRSLAEASARVWPTVATHLWQTSVILLLLVPAALLLRRAPARLCCLFWWVVLAKLLLPLSWLGGQSGRLLASLLRSESAASTASVAVGAWFYPRLVPAADGAAGAGPRTICTTLTVLWVLGVAGLLVRWAWRARPGVRRAAPIPDTRRLAPRLLEALRATTIPPHRVSIVERPTLPSVSGLFRPRIRVPLRAVETLDAEELRAVLLHEEAHRRRRDPLLAVALRLAAVALFFYPPVWWLVRRIRETTELACDEAVLAAGVPARRYARSLARMLQLGLSPEPVAVAIHGGRSALRRRFDRLRLQGRYPTMPRHRLALVVAVLVVALGSVAPVVPGSPPQKQSSPSAAGSSAALDHLARGGVPVDAEFHELPVSTVLDGLARQGGFDLVVHGPLPERRLTFELRGVRLKEALMRVALEAGLRYAALSPWKLEVRSAGPLLAGMGGVTNPILIPESKVEPEYPDELREAAIPGRVVLQAVIDELGSVRDLEVLQVKPAGAQALIDSATAAVSRWRYRPATLEGKPVAVYFTVLVDYRLDEDAGKEKASLH